MSTSLKTTPLHNIQQSLGAKMVPFAGWEMPVQFTSIVDEHQAVRKNWGVFDTSHMGQFFIAGKDALVACQYVLTNDINKLKDGDCQYSLLLNESGGIVDDLIVSRVSENKYFFVVNAANISKDFNHLEKILETFKVELSDESENLAMLAVQGPQSLEKLKELGFEIPETGFQYSKSSFLQTEIHITTTGYTGEKGVECFIAKEKAADLYQALLDAGALPCGLGARDILRLEKGLSLYGHELKENINPIEAGLNWTVAWDTDFFGKSALEEHKKNCELKRLVGFKLADKGIARDGARLLDAQEREIGSVTSGAYSPTLACGFGLAYFNYSEGPDEFFIEVRKRKLRAIRHSRRFF